MEDIPYAAVERQVLQITDGWLKFNKQEVVRSGRVIVGDLSGMAHELDVISPLVEIMIKRGAQEIVVATHDIGMARQKAALCEPTLPDVLSALEKFSYTCVLIFSSEPTAPILLHTDADYLLVGALPTDLEEVFGDLRELLVTFTQIMNDPDPEWRATLEGVYQLMDGIPSWQAGGLPTPEGVPKAPSRQADGLPAPEGAPKRLGYVRRSLAFLGWRCDE